MSAIETVQQLMSAVEANDSETAAQLLSDDFTFRGWTPKPLNKSTFLAVMRDLKAGIPGMVFGLRVLSEEDNTLHGTITVTGTQTDTINIPALSLPPIPQMGTSINLPPEEVDYTVDQGRVRTMTVHSRAGGGIRAMLQQLGTDSTILQ